MPDRRRLRLFDETIAHRVDAIADAHPWWPCRCGCDGCCRNLGDVPRATAAEWARVGEALHALDETARAVVHRDLDAFCEDPDRQPVGCPLLDRERGACRIYEARPLACRSYGFFVSRGDGRWCGLVEAALDAHPDEASAITFGNRDALDHEVRAALGDTIAMDAWWRSARPADAHSYSTSSSDSVGPLPSQWKRR